MGARFFSRVALTLALFAAACGGGGGATQSGNSSSIITNAGGSVTSASVATITAPPNAFAVPTSVAISQVDSAQLATDLDADVHLFAAQQIMPLSVRVVLGNDVPSAPLSVTLILPASYVSSKPSGYSFRVLAASMNASSLESPGLSYNLIDPTFNAGQSSLTFQADPFYFTPTTGANLREGTFVVVMTPG